MNKKNNNGFSFFLLIILFVLVSSVFPQSLDFFQERIEIKIHSDSCLLKGDYYFRNNEDHPVSTTILYPFIVNDTLPFPRNISVTSDDSKIKFIKKSNGLLFQLNLTGKEILKFTVEYTQLAPYKQIEYILTSTKTWGKPFDNAEYIIKIPYYLQLEKSSLEFESNYSRDEVSYFYMKKENYLPEKNIVLSWREK